MRLFCNIIRDGVTATSAWIDTIEVNDLRRWFMASMHHSGYSDVNRYHLIAYSPIQDISGTDLLEELVNHHTGTVYNIINKRVLTGSFIEYDLEPKAEANA